MINKMKQICWTGTYSLLFIYVIGTANAASYPALNNTFDGLSINYSVSEIPLQLAVNDSSTDSESQTDNQQNLIQFDNGNEDNREKKCMTICQQWGEDCVYNPTTGARKCRRACKRFGEECF